MSLYIGSNTNDDKILHITKGTNSPQDMKDGVLPDTVFHSSLPYFSIEKYEYTPNTLLPNWVSIDAKGAFTIDLGLAGRIFDQKLMYLILLDGIPYLKGTRQRVMSSVEASTILHTWVRPAVPVDSRDDISGSPSVNHTTYLVDVPFSVATLYVLNHVPVPTTSNDIIINSDMFIVNGINLFTYKFLATEVINTRDVSFMLSGKAFQVVNDPVSGITGTGVQLYSGATESFISLGGHKLFTTLANTLAVYRPSSYYTASIPSTNGYTTSITIPEYDPSKAVMAFVHAETTTDNCLTQLSVVNLTSTSSTEIFYISTYYNSYEPYHRLSVSCLNGVVTFTVSRPTIGGATITGYSNTNIVIRVIY